MTTKKDIDKEVKNIAKKFDLKTALPNYKHPHKRSLWDKIIAFFERLFRKY